MINNPNCVDTISIYLDGDLVKDQERPRPKQTKFEIKYAHTKCRSYSVTLTVEVNIKGKEACYKASSRLTYHIPFNETQQQECLRKVEAEEDAKEREKQGIDKLRSSEQSDKIITPTETIPTRQHHISPKSSEETFGDEEVQSSITFTATVKNIRKNGTEPPSRTFQSLPNITIPKKLPNTTKRIENPDTIDEDVETGLMMAEAPNEKPETENSLIFIGGMSFAGGLVVMMALLVIVYLVRRRRRRRGKFNIKQAVDVNFTYGTYSDYFSDYNTVEDTNDYYSSHI